VSFTWRGAQSKPHLVTLKGYDNMTGVGTPNGQDFIRALRNHDK